MRKKKKKKELKMPAAPRFFFCPPPVAGQPSPSAAASLPSCPGSSFIFLPASRPPALAASGRREHPPPSLHLRWQKEKKAPPTSRAHHPNWGRNVRLEERCEKCMQHEGVWRKGYSPPNVLNPCRLPSAVALFATSEINW